jgi:hypothetical protein
MARTVKLLRNGVDPVGAPDFTLPVSIIAQVIPQLDVNIAAQSIPTLNINISSITSGVVFNVAQSGPWTVNVSNTSFDVNVTNSSLTVTVIGTVDVNVTNSSLTVTISGTPTINVQTSGGANIVIDKLTQGAYTERRSTLANNGTTPTMTANNLTYKRGKFFPRGCRGFITTLEIYCDNADTNAHTFTVKVSPMLGMAPILTYTLNVAAGSSAAWRSITVRKMWNYDSMLIWVSCDNNSWGRIGSDAGAPYDAYDSTDEVTWIEAACRYWFRVNFTGETVGDLPVSGTVNNIEVPSISSSAGGLGDVSVPSGSETTLLSLTGPGELTGMELYITFNNAYWYVYVDDVKLNFLGRDYLNVLEWYDRVGVNTGGGVNLVKYDTTNERYTFQITEPLQFKRSLRVTVLHSSGYTETARASARYIVKMT